MPSAQALIRRVEKTRNGFSDIQKAAEEVFAGQSAAETLKLAHELFASDVHQARMLATFLFGRLAATSKTSLTFLRQRVSRDADWRVQEILAQAFDRYCKDAGYERSLPVIKAWLANPHPNVRRAVSEGLRIWTTRDYFREHPQAAIRLLSALRADESEYVRKSAGNALRDISRQHPQLIAAELAKWDTRDERIRQTRKLAAGFLK
jgi:3-methyladenine DNA glycosylase AlkD